MSITGQATRTTWLLELTKEAFRPAYCEAAGFEIRQVETPCPEFNWFLHEAIGAHHRWGGRESWTAADWRDYVASEQIETWVAYLNGSPAGYYELEFADGAAARIACLGLLPRHIGQGFGAHLLSHAAGRCWQRGANRIWLKTSSDDHTHALPNYHARGFRTVEQSESDKKPPRESAVFRTQPPSAE